MHRYHADHIVRSHIDLFIINFFSETYTAEMLKSKRNCVTFTAQSGNAYE